ncbi:hypothetical protein QTP88_022191 [Uroleucon formosanum]
MYKDIDTRYNNTCPVVYEIYYYNTGIMNIDICNIYRTLCLKSKVSANEFIVSCLYNASVYGELNLKSTTLTENSCSLIAETIKCEPTIKIFNLSDCLLPVGGLKIFLDLVNKLTNLKILNLKGNQIGNKLTVYISKILLNNTNITELQLDWNNIGDSEDTFSQLCHSLMSNTVLNTLNLANNNLCQTCGFHLAKMLTINKCLKMIDLSWNCIGESGAALLLKSLKNNDILIELNIQGNSVSVEMSSMIAKQLKQNESFNEINQNEVQIRSLSLFEHVASVNKNYQAQLNIINNQYHNSVDELKSKLQLLQSQNQVQKQELEELKNNSLKEQENYILISNQVKKMKSEASFNKQSLNLLIKKISNEVPNSDMESMNSLEDLEKIVYIIKKIKKNYSIKILHKKEQYHRLLEAFPKLTNELNILKGEWENLKYSTELNIKDYSDELIDIKKLLLTNMFHLKISNKISHELNMNNLIVQEEELNISDEQTKVLVLLNTKIKTLHKEKIDLEIKLAEEEKHSLEANQTVRVLQNNLIFAKNELIKLNEMHLYNIAAQTTNTQLNADKLTKEINTLKNNLVEKDSQLQLCKIEIDEMNINHKTELLNLKKNFQLEYQKFEVKRKEDQKQIEEIYLMFKKHFAKLKIDALKT